MHALNGQSMRLQPRFDCGYIRICWAVEAAEFLRFERLAKLAASRGVRGFDDIPECFLLRSRALQKQKQPAGGQRRLHGTPVKFGQSQRMDAAMKRQSNGVI